LALGGAILLPDILALGGGMLRVVVLLVFVSVSMLPFLGFFSSLFVIRALNHPWLGDAADAGDAGDAGDVGDDMAIRIGRQARP